MVRETHQINKISNLKKANLYKLNYNSPRDEFLTDDVLRLHGKHRFNSRPNHSHVFGENIFLFFFIPSRPTARTSYMACSWLPICSCNSLVSKMLWTLPALGGACSSLLYRNGCHSFAHFHACLSAKISIYLCHSAAVSTLFSKSN